MTRLHPIVRWLVAALIGVTLFTLIFIIKGNGQILPLPSYLMPDSQNTSQNALQTDDIRTLLVLIAQEDGHISCAALVMRDARATTVKIYGMDPHALVDLGSDKLIDIRSAGFEAGPARIQSAIQEASGVRVDATLELSPLALAALVDSVHGIDVTVAQPVHVSVSATEHVTIPAGTQHVTGTVAAHYVLSRYAGESLSAQLSRVAKVLVSIFSALPKGVDHVAQTLAELGSAARTTVPTGDLATMLSLIQQRGSWGATSVGVLDTVVSSLNLTYLPQAKTFSLSDIYSKVQKDFPNNMLRSGESPYRVLVVGRDAAARLNARKQLLNTDYLTGSRFVFLDGVSNETSTQTMIYTLDATPNELVAQLEKRLDLTNAQVFRVGSALDATFGADFVVTLGTDYISHTTKNESGQ